MATLTASDVTGLVSYALLAVLGRRVIHPGSRASTDPLLQWAAVCPDERVLESGWATGTTAIRLAREYGAAVAAAHISPLMREGAKVSVSAARLDGQVRVQAKGLSRAAYLRKVPWLWPRMSPAVPYLGNALVMARKPGRSAEGPAS